MPHCLLAFDKCFRNSGFHWLIYWRGLLGQAKHKIDKLFHSLSGSRIWLGFGATMTKNRSRFLMSHISLDDFACRDGRREYGDFAGFPLIFEIFIKSCRWVITPHDCLALDETLCPTRTGLNFKQYYRSKPAKYRMLFRSINLARFPYTFTAVVYARRPKQHNSDLCKYYVRGTEEMVKTLVTNLKRCTSSFWKKCNLWSLLSLNYVRKVASEKKLLRWEQSKQIKKEFLWNYKPLTAGMRVGTKFIGTYQRNNEFKFLIVNTKISGKSSVLMLSTTLNQ